jgi:hypothetical protein
LALSLCLLTLAGTLSYQHYRLTNLTAAMPGRRAKNH